MYFQLMAANIDIQRHRHRTVFPVVYLTFFVLPDLGNMGVNVLISLLLCIRAEIYVMSYLLPVNGRHL